MLSRALVVGVDLDWAMEMQRIEKKGEQGYLTHSIDDKN